ncbi:V-type proton ATPase subunit C-like isoform X2 [Drosophila guanche]|uniref:V-type proton ATPase subunit C-like isoform X2 n=1 Tax=Drosophila guanche TaxID=7266 RepID=UPI001471F92D|nr:V-type proton ATPase subunit C-like isoform X2 [Drosophila guanche]
MNCETETLMDTGPGPPDDSMPCRHHQRIKNLSLRHQRKHQHTHHQNKPQHYHLQHHHQLPQDIKGKSTSTTTNQLSPSRDPSQAPSTPTLPSAAAAAAAGTATATVPFACTTTTTTPVPGSGSGGSLNNLSTTHDESERDFDFVIPPQTGGCLCDECGVFAPPSTSATASTLVADECYSHTASSMLSATRSALSTMAAIATGSSLTGGSSVGGASTSAAAAAAHAHGPGHGHPPAAAAASAPAKNSSASTLCSSAYFSTSAPTTSSSVHSMSRSNSKKLNNNTCSINHNKLSFRSGSHNQQRRNLSSSSPLQSPTQKSCDSSDLDAEVDGDGDTTDGDPKSPHSARSSDLSETFDWWFNKPKRNSKKSSAHQSEHQQPQQQPQPQQQQQHQHPQQQQQQQQSKAMTFWHQASTTPRSSYRSFFNSLADQIYSKRSTSSQLNINNGFNLTPTHRSSPVSSCCGSSSQGRSSPDTDIPEPPEFPLSPG